MHIKGRIISLAVRRLYPNNTFPNNFVNCTRTIIKISVESNEYMI